MSKSIHPNQLESTRVPGSKRGLVTGFVGAIELDLAKSANDNPEFIKLYKALEVVQKQVPNDFRSVYGMCELKNPKLILDDSIEIDGHNYPARLIVRDSHLTDDSANELKVGVNTGLYMTERKFENGLDRITAAAVPRQFEGVPKGVVLKR